MKYIVTIRQAEGGQDSRLFCNDLLAAYQKLAKHLSWPISWITNDATQICLHIDADRRLEQESGGHRIQRVPPTERRGRVHTSTITVSVVDQGVSTQTSPNSTDIRFEYFSGTGKGGQHRNKHQNCVRAIHTRSGISETCQAHRERSKNEREAMENLIRKIDETTRKGIALQQFQTSRTLAGSGERGDKIRTYRFQDDIATDHRTGAKTSVTSLLNGEFWKVWKWRIWLEGYYFNPKKVANTDIKPVRGEDGWLHIEPGVGNHIDANGHIDMVINCPYIPLTFQDIPKNHSCIIAHIVVSPFHQEPIIDANLPRSSLHNLVLWTSSPNPWNIHGSKRMCK